MRYLITILFFFSINTFGFSKTNTDSLKSALSSATDENKLEILSNLIAKFQRTDPQISKDYFKQFEELYIQLKNPEKYIGSYFHFKGNNAMHNGEYANAINYFKKAESNYIALKKYNALWNLYNTFGGVYDAQGNLSEELNYYLKALKIAEEKLDEGAVAGSAINLGVTYAQMGKTKEALSYFHKSCEYHSKFTNSWGYGNCLNNIGQVYAMSGTVDSALLYYTQALKVWESMSDDGGIAMTSFNLGSLYIQTKEYKKAETLLLRSLDISIKNNDQFGITQNYGSLSNMFFDAGQSEKGLVCLNQSIDYAKKNKIYPSIKDGYFNLYTHFKKANDFKKALAANENFYAWYDSLNSSEKTKKLAELYSKKDKEILLLNKEKIISDAQFEKQQTQKNILLISIIIAIVFVLLIFRGYSIKQKSNTELSLKNTLIEKQKSEVQYQKERVEEKQKEILDSINYAQRIQQAILPEEKMIKMALPQSFILFKPSNIVSGDFYWFSEIDNLSIFAVMDCTGHGVPGAFMSMIGNALLNEIVYEKKITEPATILNYMNDGVRLSLKQNQLNNENHDGMDIALCTFQKNLNGSVNLYYAGAHRPIYIIKENKIQEILADKFPIGGMQSDDKRIFTNHTISLSKNDTIYMFTDGYLDQFGGEKGKKFMSKRFQKLLLSIQQLPMDEQQQELTNALQKWQGKLDQVDDILVVGIKI
jgi:serine phosphatase RsbU (regulator of sigma subunit)